MTKKVRSLSDSELFLCDVQDLYNSYTIQFLMEFTGNITVEEMDNAINSVVIENPDINVCKSGNNWILNNEKIKVKELFFKDENNLLEDDFFNEGVDFRKSIMELYLLNIKNKKSRFLLFKIFHGVVDGKGALLIVDNFINKICGKETLILKNDLTTKEFVKNLDFYNKNARLRAKYSLKNIKKIDSFRLEWNIVTIDKYVSGISAKVAKIFQKYFINDEVLFFVPVDLRNHDRGSKRIGNLILPVYLDVHNGDSIDEINGNLLSQLKSKKELNMYNVKCYNYHIFPEKNRKLTIKWVFKYFMNRNKFFYGAIVSHLGRIGFDSSSKINIENIISLPNLQPATPLSVVITECNNKTNIAICNYKGQIPNEMMDSIIKDMEAIE